MLTQDILFGMNILTWRDVLPDSGQHHDIEADRQRTEDAQFRKLVVDPADAWVGVKALPLRAHAARRLHGNYFVALGREPSGVTS